MGCAGFEAYPRTLKNFPYGGDLTFGVFVYFGAHACVHNTQLTRRGPVGVSQLIFSSSTRIRMCAWIGKNMYFGAAWVWKVVVGSHLFSASLRTVFWPPFYFDAAEKETMREGEKKPGNRSFFLAKWGVDPDICTESSFFGHKVIYIRFVFLSTRITGLSLSLIYSDRSPSPPRVGWLMEGCRTWHEFYSYRSQIAGQS